MLAGAGVIVAEQVQHAMRQKPIHFARQRLTGGFCLPHGLWPADDHVAEKKLARGRRVVFAEDAARGLDEARVAASTAAWRESGVEFSTSDRIAASL